VNFTLADLSAFVAVAERCNFRAAAEAVHLSQPALSRRIDKLEEALGVRLFDRSTRHVALTHVGRQFEPRARKLLHDLQEALLVVSDAAASHVPEVRIACVTSAVRHFLADALKAFRQRHPRLRVKIADGGAQDVLDSVARGDVDVGFSFLGEGSPELAFRPVLADPYVAICSRDHALAGVQQLTWDELAQYDYIAVNRNNANRTVIDLALAGRTVLKPVCEVRRMAGLLALVESGVGVAAVPRLALPTESAVLVTIPLVEPAVDRLFGVVSRAGASIAPAATAFLDFFGEWVGTRTAPPRRAAAAARTDRIDAIDLRDHAPA
jgi:DNA-binding transcriptional LysR family regulator